MRSKQAIRFLASSANLGLLLFLLAVAWPAAVQGQDDDDQIEVTGYTTLTLIPNSGTNTYTLTTYSITEVNGMATSYGFTPDIAAQLEDANGHPIAWANPDSPTSVPMGFQNGATTACQPDDTGDTSSVCVALEVDNVLDGTSSSYAVVAYHFVWGGIWDEAKGCYDNLGDSQDGDEYAEGDGGQNDVGWTLNSAPGDCAGSGDQEIYLGYSDQIFSGSAPTISGISPPGGSLGTTLASNATIAVNGQNLMTEGTQAAPSVAMTDPGTGQPTSGVTVSVTSPAPTDELVTLNYSIASNAGTGPQNLTLSTLFGSSTVQFTIGDPTPSISSVQPGTPSNPWVAGTMTQFTISGTGFGTNPAITITGNGISGCLSVTMTQPGGSCSIQSAGDTQIGATVTIPSNAGSTATIQVQSNGYGGSGFLQGTPGQPSQSLPYANVAIESIPAPVPQIMFLGSNVANTTVPVQVGQQIALTAVVPGLSGNLFVQSQGWTAPTGSVVGGFQASTASGCTLPLPMQSLPSDCPGMATTQDLNSASFTYYWVDSASNRTMTYSYTLNNGNSNSATVTFNVTGPQVKVTVLAGTAGVWTNAAGQTNLEFLGVVTPSEFNQPAGSASGIVFQAQQPGFVPYGSFEWIQIVQDKETVLTQSGSTTQYSTAPSGPLLDTGYPYPKVATSNQDLVGQSTPNDLAIDTPKSPLCGEWGEIARNFSATMYLMWTPPSASAIPVPLGSINWGWSEDAINTLNPNNTNIDGTQANGWVPQSCTSPAPPPPPSGHQLPFTQSNVFPAWTGLTLSPGYTCQH